MRCFLAIPLREPALGMAQRTLALLRERVDAVRWSRPETLHITVHFFGNIDDSQSASALAAVTPVVKRTRAFPVALDTLGAFPSRRSPRVLWLGSGADNPPLAAFALACRDALRMAGFTVDDRPFRAHCTLGRPRDPWPAAARDAWITLASTPREPATFDADRVVLYQSVTGAGGAVHTPLTTMQLDT